MPRVFISCRREDSAVVTGRIYDRLVGRFGRENVFKDVDSIAPGKDFREGMGKAVSEANVSLVVIGTLLPRDLETGACLRTLEGHRFPVTSVSVSPDGRRAVSGSCDNTLRVWDLDSGQCMAAYQAVAGESSVT